MEEEHLRRGRKKNNYTTRRGALPPCGLLFVLSTPCAIGVKPRGGGWRAINLICSPNAAAASIQARRAGGPEAKKRGQSGSDIPASAGEKNEKKKKKKVQPSLLSSPPGLFCSWCPKKPPTPAVIEEGGERESRRWRRRRRRRLRHRRRVTSKRRKIASRPA